MLQNLRHKTINGLKWSYLATLVSALIQLAYTIVINRLLTPTEFGMIAMANVVLRFGSYFSQMGLGAALVQKKELKQTDIRATFTLALLFSIIIYVGIYVLAPFLIKIFDQPKPELIPIIRLLGITFIINGVTAISQNILRRNMAIKALAMTEVVTYFLGYVCVGIGLAWYGFGVWSIVFAGITQSAINLIALYRMVRHSIVPIIGFQFYKPILNYGSKLSMISFLEFIKTNLDTMLIGKTLGFYQLGLYNRVMFSLRLPLVQINASLTRVIFPALSAIQNDLKKLSEVYLKSTLLLSCIILTFTGFCLGSAREIIQVLLGQQYLEAIHVFQVLAFGVGFQFIGSLAGVVCDATAYLKPKTVFTLIHLITVIILIWSLKTWGLIGIAWAMAINNIIKTIGFSILMKRLLKIPFRTQVKNLMPALFNFTIIASGVSISSYLFNQLGWHFLLILILNICVFLILGVSIIRQKYNEPVRNFISEKILSQHLINKIQGSPVMNILNFLKFRVAK
ncbi:lipopolysaccharide biosynthesis protein [Persicobacter diffluens]|uniref:Lipopolysaccharide biosynthesis protein n=1 Tax=Persicobacter diffluens TaxID=981 RepID=A0AAN4W3W4_9BACT|nr:lipopolysaccharide biosynthesis protein [Persicobacter diffluens]